MQIAKITPKHSLRTIKETRAFDGQIIEEEEVSVPLLPVDHEAANTSRATKL